MSLLPPPPATLAERRPVALATALTEFLLIGLAGSVGYWVRFGGAVPSHSYLFAIAASALVITVTGAVVGCYQSWRGAAFLVQIGRVYTAWLLALAILLALAVVLHVSATYSRIWFGMSMAFGAVAITLFRLALFLVLRHTRLQGRNLKKVLIVESGHAAQQVRDRLGLLPQYGYQVASVVKLQYGLEWTASLMEQVRDAGVHELWLCLPLEDGPVIRPIVHAVRNLLVDVRYFPDLSDIPILNQRVGEVAGLLTLDINRSPMAGPMRWIKRAEDILIGVMLFFLMLPVCMVVAVAVKCSSPGPVLFKQYRTGINGRRFKVYKFRSMAVHVESGGAVTQAHRNDLRVTRVGAFLRRTSLDELPQFFNVLQGRMSIVGPRPHALAHNEYYKDLVESYMQRHKVKPGITGWAQVNGYRGETDTLEKMEKRVEYDLWYINHWSLGLDLKIIAMTIFKGFLNEQP